MRKLAFQLPGIVGFLTLLGAVLLITQPVLAEEIEGKYELISPPQPSSTKGRVEVIEVFSYSCPHCYSFLSTMEKLQKAAPEYVDVKHLPAIFRPSWEIHAKAYYTAELLGVADKTHRAFFEEVHAKGKPMNTTDALRKFFTDQGVSTEQFDKTFDSFAVDMKIRQSKVLQAKYGISGTPTVVVNGKYRVTGSSAGSLDNVITVVNALAEREHKAIAAVN